LLFTHSSLSNGLRVSGEVRCMRWLCQTPAAVTRLKSRSTICEAHVSTTWPSRYRDSFDNANPARLQKFHE
jgi:hypothetical protein